MNKKDRVKLDIVSNIDNQIIEGVSRKRVRLSRHLQGFQKGKRVWISVSAIAATLAFVGGLFLAFLLLDQQTPVYEKQVPVYQGMTVSESAPTVMQYGYPGEVHSMPISAPSVFGESKKNDKDKENKKNSLRDALDVTGADRALYYAKPNEDVYITIHINNPDDFEILSFTLNGEKFSAYMFEKGSNMENIVIKVNVGDAEGIVDYTIDAIKYVDGTEIKDVRMEGDKTVKIGVYPQKQPTASIGEEKVELFSLSYQVTVSDELSLISVSQGEVYALLMDGETVVAKKPLEIGKTQAVTFEGLQHDKEYELMIVACYDALDSQGFDVHILEEKAVKTQYVVEITNALLGKNGGISFELNQSQSVENRIEKIELIDSSGNVVATGDASARQFDCSLYVESYMIAVTYTYTVDGREYSGVKTSDKMITNRIRASLIMKNGTITGGCSSPGYQIFIPSIGGYSVHFGIDISPAEGAEGDNKVYAAASGTVTKIWHDSWMGYCVAITTKTHDGELIIRYKGLDKESLTVQEGDVIVGGAELGVVKPGSLEWKDPNHIHIEINHNGVDVDPTAYIY